MGFQTTGGNPLLIPPGEHTVTLMGLPTVRCKSSFSIEADGMVDKIAWEFQSAAVGPNDEPYRFTHWSNVKYGSSKAGLTKTLNQMVPGMNQAMAATFNQQALIGTRYKVYIRHKRSDDGTRTFVEMVDIAPMDSTPIAQTYPAAAPPPSVAPHAGQHVPSTPAPTPLVDALPLAPSGMPFATVPDALPSPGTSRKRMINLDED